MVNHFGNQLIFVRNGKKQNMVLLFYISSILMEYILQSRMKYLKENLHIWQLLNRFRHHCLLVGAIKPQYYPFRPCKMACLQGVYFRSKTGCTVQMLKLAL